MPPEPLSPAPVQLPPEAADGLIKIPSPLIFSGISGDFKVYIRLKDRFVLYAAQRERISRSQLTRLIDYDIRDVFIPREDKPGYDHYLQDSLGRVLADERLPLEDRAVIFHQASQSLIQDLFAQRNLGRVLAPEQGRLILDLVASSVDFLVSAGSLKNLANLINHDYSTYRHCLHVFVYATAILQTYALPRRELIDLGVGNLLHDIGKQRIPEAILKKPGPLTYQEREVVKTHTLEGAAMCGPLRLNALALGGIISHHERLDGQGYPYNLREEEIPLPVRVTTVCDIYDALTSDRSYSQKRTPFEALKLMRYDMGQALDQEVVKRFILVLRGAEVV